MNNDYKDLACESLKMIDQLLKDIKILQQERETLLNDNISKTKDLIRLKEDQIRHWGLKL